MCDALCEAEDALTAWLCGFKLSTVLNPLGLKNGGLDMIFFGERKKLAPILKRHMPDQKIETFEPEALKDEVE